MITDVVAWIRALMERKPWLLVGKGPSADYCDRVVPDTYHVLTLNHACSLLRPTLAHFTDLEALQISRFRGLSP